MRLNGSKLHEKKTTLYLERDEERRESFLKELENIPLEKRIYLDESGMNQYLYREYGKGPKGQKVFGEISIVLQDKAL